MSVASVRRIAALLVVFVLASSCEPAPPLGGGFSPPVGGHLVFLLKDQEWTDWRPDLLHSIPGESPDGLSVVEVGGVAMPGNDWRVVQDVVAEVRGVQQVIGQLHVTRDGQVNFQRTADLSDLTPTEYVLAAVGIVASDGIGRTIDHTINIYIAGESKSTSHIIAADPPMTEAWRDFIFDFSLPNNLDAEDFDAYVEMFKTTAPTVNTIRFPINGAIFGSRFEEYFWNLANAYAKAGYEIFFYYHDGNLMDSDFDLSPVYDDKVGSLDNPGAVFRGWSRFLDLLLQPERAQIRNAIWGLEFLNEPVAYDQNSPQDIAAYALDSVDFYRLVETYVDRGLFGQVPKVLINGMGYATEVALLATVNVTDPATGIQMDGLTYVRNSIPADKLVWSTHAYTKWSTSTPAGLNNQLGNAYYDSVLMTETHFRGANLFNDDPNVRTLEFMLGLEDWARSSMDFGVSWWPATGPWSQHGFPFMRVTGSNDPLLNEGDSPSSQYWESYGNFEEGERFVAAIRYGNMAGLLNFDFVANHLDSGTVRRGSADGLEQAATYGSRFDDVLEGTGEASIILGGLGSDIIRVSAGENYLFGHEGNDVIFGGTERDLLVGGDGNDQLIGNLGQNWMVGGAGSDRFAVRDDGDADRIMDFVAGQDRLAIEVEGPGGQSVQVNNGNAYAAVNYGGRTVAYLFGARGVTANDVTVGSITAPG